MVSTGGHQLQRKLSGKRQNKRLFFLRVTAFVVLCLFGIRNSVQTYYYLAEYNDNNSLFSEVEIELDPTIDVDAKTNFENLQKNALNKDIDTTADTSAPLPDWITQYIKYHNEIRAQFPGKELFTNPDAPSLLIRVCLGLCGGLHDRLGQLPLDLSIANETGRIFLIQWHKPHPLEEYLLPNDFDWTVPEGVGFDDMHAARAHTYLDFEPGSSTEELDTLIHHMIYGDLSKIKILNTKLLGDQKGELLSSRLKKAQETDMIDDTLTFGRVFWSFFQIHPNIQNLINEQKQILNLSSNHYVAVHCRTRHPKGWSKDKPSPRAEVEGFPADKSDIVFEGYEKAHTVSVATHAIQCVRKLQNDHPPQSNGDEKEPIYLMTDTFKVTNHMTLSPESPFYDPSKKTDAHLIARDDSIPSFHIDRKKGRTIEEHYGTFLDLFLMVEARCITFGIGNFGRFAAKISGTKCLNQHRQVEWDTHDAPRWFATPCKVGANLE